MRHRLKLRQILSEKWKEALQAVLPIITIVLALSFTIAPLSPSVLLCFLMGAVLILVGMMFFTTGAETAMTPMGERIGTAMTKTKKLGVVITLSFLLGFIITVSEPDLQVLASQVPSVPNLILILSVACGVGVFLVVSLLRMLFSIALPPLLVGCYAVVFLLAFFVPPEFLAVAFDSGGVTTGPMTVPFIMALGVGISAIRSDRHAADDSFGLVALSSIGPILAVMILGIIYNPNESTYTPPILPEMQDSSELFELFRPTSSRLPSLSCRSFSFSSRRSFLFCGFLSANYSRSAWASFIHTSALCCFLPVQMSASCPPVITSGSS